MESPKLFISYGWSNPQHEKWVLNLATELREECGVDVILNKWDLKEGHELLLGVGPRQLFKIIRNHTKKSLFFALRMMFLTPKSAF